MTTWSTILSELEEEFDIDFSAEENITENQMLYIANMLQEEVYMHIINLHEDYYKTSDYVNLVDGTSAYSMPTDIYLNKLRFVQYNYNNKKYKVTRISEEEKVDVDSNDDYMYDIENSTASGTQFVLYPASRITESSSAMKRVYIRQVIALTGGSSVIDIPSTHYIKYGLRKYVQEELGLQTFQVGLAEKQAALELTLNTMRTMIPDDDDTIKPDFSHYGEHE